jgi:hypothetical protein
MKILEISDEIGEDGWLQQSIMLEVEGETVQLVRYDGDDNSILVKIGDRVKDICSEKISDFVRRRLGLI